MERIKIIVSEMLRIFLHVFYIFPIKQNRVIFCSYMGRHYSCNPKYVSEYLEKNYKGRFDLIWCFTEPDKYVFLKQRGIRVCKMRSMSFYYYRMTSKVLVNNSSFGAEIPKRKGQYNINTWHGGGGGYKRIINTGTEYYRSRREKGELDLICASSETSLKNTVRGAFQHEGEFFPGTPRNDMFINMDRDDIRQQVYDYFKLPAGTRIMLYAPTFREDDDLGKGQHDYGLDFDLLHKALVERFGGTWVIAVRYHPIIKNYTIPESPILMDATNYPEMQDLLYSVDAMITDYSSSLWDFSFTNKPCFLFCSDLKEYREKRGFNKPIEEWGFPVAETNEQLYERIIKWDKDEHLRNMDAHHADNGSFEDGKATQRLCQLIAEKCGIDD